MEAPYTAGPTEALNTVALRVLVVDDTPADRELIARALSRDRLPACRGRARCLRMRRLHLDPAALAARIAPRWEAARAMVA